MMQKTIDKSKILPAITHAQDLINRSMQKILTHKQSMPRAAEKGIE
jgi:hypothetical protein